MGAHGTKKTVYEIVTEQILKALEQGVVPWRKPWATGFHLPVNITGRRYRGINRVLLGLAEFASPVWLTWKQVEQRGGHVKRGEHAQLVVYWLERNRALPGSEEPKVRERASGGNRRESDEGERTGRSGGIVPLYYRVFNVEQTEGIEVPEALVPPKTAFTLAAREVLNLADGIVRTMPNPPSIGMGGARAYYRPGTDHIQMPPHEVFRDAAGYATTLFHEATHATGHPSRLGRVLPETLAPFGSEDYSREELVAEIGACFLLRRTGIGSDLSNSTAYIRGWLKALKDNPTWVIGAATQAQRSSDYILGPEEPRAAEQPSAEDADTTGGPPPTVAPSLPAPADPPRVRWAGIPATAPKLAQTRPSVAEPKATRKISAPEVRRPSARPAGSTTATAKAAKVAMPAVAPSRAEGAASFPRLLNAAGGALDVSVARNALADAWTRVRKAVPRHHHLASLMQVHLQAADGVLLLTGSDGEWVRQESLSAEVHRSGAVTVGAAPVQTLLGKLRGSASLRLAEESPGWIELRTGGTRYRIPAGAIGDYPSPFRLSEEARTATTSGKSWARGLGLVAHAMGTDDTRPALTGVHLDRTSDGLRLAATDGHRLAVATVAAGEILGEEEGRILPGAVVPALAAMVRGVQAVTVRWDSIGVEFLTASGRLAARWVDAEYPDFTRILESSQPHRARVPVAEWKGAIERVRAVAANRAAGIRLELEPHELIVASTDATSGEALESVPVRYDGPAIRIGFDPGYLLGVLEVARGAEEVVFSVREELSAASFRIDSDPGFVAIVMPMRL